MSDLTTLANARAWLSIDAADSASDTLLSRLIRAKSAQFTDQVGRELARRSYVETFDGSDDSAIRTRQAISPWIASGYAGGAFGLLPRGWALNLAGAPVIPGTFTLTIDGASVPAGSNPNQDTQVDGWLIKDGYRVELLGSTYSFTRGLQNIVAAYDAGYYVSGEQQAIPATPFQVTALQTFLSDVSVAFVGGAALAKVASAPAAGQYAVDANSLYTFAAADTGKTVALTYAAVPPDVEQAVLDMVAYDFRGRDRIGERSKTIGSENVSFLVDGIPPSAQAVIDQYRRVQV